jgi:hypothetical protein
MKAAGKLVPAFVGSQLKYHLRMNDAAVMRNIAIHCPIAWHAEHSAACQAKHLPLVAFDRARRCDVRKHRKHDKWQQTQHGKLERVVTILRLQDVA